MHILIVILHKFTKNDFKIYIKREKEVHILNQ